MRIVFLVWGVFLSTLIVVPRGQAQSDPAELFFDYLTIQDGLSHNTVHCLLQDRYGYIWIGTQNGLNKYDGYSFDVFRSHQSTGELPGVPGDFAILVDGVSIPITDMEVDTENPRIIRFAVDYVLKSTEEIEISYSGSEVQAQDGTELQPFTLEEVKNTLNFVHQLPGRIEAEDFMVQSGVELEETTDTGGGQNIGYLDPGDYLEYEINITAAGSYQVKYRTASLNATGGLQMSLLDGQGGSIPIHTATFPSTGGWQNWATNTQMAELPEGRYTLRIEITQTPFNLNWMEFSLTTAVHDPVHPNLQDLRIYPNPGPGDFRIRATLSEEQPLWLAWYDLSGRILGFRELSGMPEIDERISLRELPDGPYICLIRSAEGIQFSTILLKSGD